MKFPTFCFAVLLIISSSRRRGCFGEIENRLVLLYHPYEDRYLLSDSATIQNRTPASSVSKYTHIVSFCAVQNRLPVFDHLLLEVKQIVSADSFRNGENDLGECDPDYEVKPVTLYQSNYKAYTVSYIIRTDSLTKKTLQEHSLGNTMFPNNYMDENNLVSHMYIFWAYFSSEKLQLTETRHRLSVHDGNAGLLECDEYRIGAADIKNMPLFFPDLFYVKERQEKLMKKFRWPNENEYFVHHQLVPIDDFTDKYSRKATCNYLNIVPVWRTISERSLRKVEEYIRNVALILPLDSLSVRTIAHRQLLLLPNKYRAKTPIPVFLNADEDKIPVPRVLIKIVSYEIPFPLWEHKVRSYIHNNYYKEMYKVAIVIHNEIKMDIQPICKDPFKCENYGWYVTDYGKDRNVYCCNVSDVIFNDYGYRRFNNAQLDLNSVPLSDDAGTIIEPLDVVEKLRKIESLASRFQ